VQDEMLSESESSTVLTDEEAKDLIQLGQEVAALFHNNPQDVEWARSASGNDNQFYIVQSRPIATLFPLPKAPAEPLQVFLFFGAIQGFVAPIFQSGKMPCPLLGPECCSGSPWVGKGPKDSSFRR